MATKTKKIILFIVEGITDEFALSPVLKNIFQNEDVRVHVVNGDITSDWLASSRNAINTVHDHIEVERKRYGFEKKDIIVVVHLVDTDGAFIPDDRVFLSSHNKIQYFDDHIESASPTTTLDRNNRKAQVLRRLQSTSKIDTIPYRVYYFSRNLEHVLHNNITTLPSDDKVSYADSFADRYRYDKEGFIRFISSDDFAVLGEFDDTWAFIMQGINSLNRHCNFHLLFKSDKGSII